MENSTKDIWQKIGELDNRSKSAHNRLDDLRREVRDDFKSINSGINDIKKMLDDEIKIINTEIRVINKYINEKQGASRAYLFVGGIAGTGLTMVVGYFLEKFL